MKALMKKSIKHIFLFAALLYAFSGCVKEPWSEPSVPGNDLPYPTDGKVSIKMCVAIPGQVPTKAMADLPQITSMRVAVFGSSGYLKESVDIDDFVSAQTNGNTTLYTFNAQLTVTDSKRLRVNIIANYSAKIPWKYEDEVMTTHLYTTGNQDAYWARFILPNGITLKTYYNDVPDTEGYQTMMYVTDQDGYYQVTDDITAAFCGGIKTPGDENNPPVYNGLPLLRNFAKISVESTTPQLVLNETTTMAVINRPDRGSVAPYNHETGQLVVDYKDYEYQDIKTIYPGFSVVGMEFEDTDPATAPFYACGKEGTTITGGIFMYERPKPDASSAPSYMIVHGTYYKLKDGVNKEDLPSNWKALEYATPGTYLDKNNGKDCYYKIDFMDDDGYYAIYRNFRYHIRITNVSKEGASTPAAAGSTGGTGDILQDTSVAGLNDISDGYGRIAVSHMGWTFVEGKAVFDLKYKFIPNVDDGDEGANNALVSEGGPVTITIGAKTDGSPKNVISSDLDSEITSATGTVVDGGTNGKVKVMGASTAKDEEGFRTIWFTVNEPDASNRATQVITITGVVGTKRLSRSIEYNLMPRQYMTVECVADEPNPDYAQNYVESISGQGVNVNITIPKMLPESMFPLIFNIESDKLSITPNTSKYATENLPVESGYSIVTGNTSNKSFHYVRTLSYTEYGKLEEVTGGKRFTCHFKTNKAESASTIYVDNEKYFHKNSAEFKNYSMYNFRNMAFGSDNTAANTAVTFSFALDAKDSGPRTVTVILDGLVQGTNSGLTPVANTEDTYTCSVTGSLTLNLKTITTQNGYDGTYAVTLNAYGSDSKAVYHEASYGNKKQTVTINPRTLTMTPSEIKVLTAEVWPLSGGSSTIAWASSNPSVATVSDGKVTALTVGTTTITATCDGISGTCTVTVNPVDVESVNLNKTTMRIGVGKTETLTATILPSNATNKNVTWSSDNPSVATVNSAGVVTGVALGNATITVTTVDGGKTATCVVNVVPTPVTGVTLNTTSGTILLGGTLNLTATVAPSDAANKNITWSTSDATIATVESTGTNTARVTASGTKTGTVTITVRTEDGSYTATCTIKVLREKVVTIETNSRNGLAQGDNQSVSSDNGEVKIDFSSLYRVDTGYVRPNRGNNTITVTASGNSVTTVVISFVSGYTHNYTVNTGSRSLSGSTWTWTGNTTSLVATSTSRDARVTSIQVTYYGY